MRQKKIKIQIRIFAKKITTRTRKKFTELFPINPVNGFLGMGYNRMEIFFLL